VHDFGIILTILAFVHGEQSKVGLFLGSRGKLVTCLESVINAKGGRCASFRCKSMIDNAALSIRSSNTILRFLETIVLSIGSPFILMVMP